MHKLACILTAILLTAAFTAGCKGSTSVKLTNTGDESLTPGITVTGVGEVKATPDIAVITLGVEASAPTASAARDAGAAAATKLIASVKSSGVADEDIQTTTVALNPQYDYPTGGSPRIVSYTSVNTVQVTLKKLEAAGSTIDSALEAAGDAGRLQGIQFGFADPQPILADARKKAMEDARARAEAFAAGAGVKVGEVRSITESTASTPVYATRMTAASLGASTPIEPGQSATTVSVTVRYAIDR